MALIDKSALLAKPTLRQESVHIDALGGEVLMGVLSTAQRLAASKRFASLADNDSEGGYKALLAQVAMSLRNEDGTPMCADDAAVDELVAALLEHPGSVADELTNEFVRIQGNAKDKLKAIVGNSDEIPSASTPSGSAGISESPAPAISQAA